VISQVNAEMADKNNLIIADGHHRYETALNYQAEMKDKFPAAAPNAGFNYRMAAMVSMSNPGLTILPTHRLIFDYQDLTLDEIMARSKDFFNVEKLDSREALESKLEDAAGQVGAIGFACSQGHYLFTLDKLDSMAELEPDRAQSWRDLDVSILHNLLLEKIMKIDPKKIDNLENIKYLREPDLGYDEIKEKDTSFLFILNSTRIDQVTACTDDGEKMPQKSTDFYPKIVTGFAMLPVQKDELL